MLGWSTLAARAADIPTNPPGPLVTNVVARRVVRDVIQTLLQVTPAGALPAPAASGTNWLAAVAQARRTGGRLITNTCAGFVPGSLAETVCAALHTNGRSPRLWEVAQIPPGWPAQPPVLRWNTNNLLWGRKGMTGFSQVFEGMGAFGQGIITALTRRHGYVRGHGMGPSGLDPTRVGRRAWFCTRDNRLIERKMQLILVRFMDEGHVRDYSLILFDADLPAEIEPLRVVDPVKVRRKYLFPPMEGKPVLMVLQAGYVSAMIGGWDIPVSGGDSGNPRLLPLPGELVFLEGITTFPPSAEMQADMDLLSRKAGLDPRQYQMQWVNLDAYPDF